MTSVLQQFPEAFAQRINKILDIPSPGPATSANNFFGGYGCRWCRNSRAWFTVLPFDMEPVAHTVAQMFRNAAVTSVTVSLEGGVPQNEGGKGFQVSAYI